MHLVLKGVCWSDCLVYLDDIIIFGRTLQEHRERLSLVLSRLSEAGLKINPKKCKPLSERVVVLSHVVTQDGISTDPEKVRVIKEWPVPEDESQLKAFLEHKFEQHAIGNAPLKPFVWWRFIDDVFMIWTEGEEHLKDFIRYLNSIHASIKFTHEYSNSSHQTLPFLDVQVHLSNNHIQTDLHTKPTDKHQYLLKTSCHPNHTKQTIPFSLFLRIRRICSTDAFFDKRSEELIKHLVQRGYSRYSLQKDANRVRAIPRHATLQPQEQKATKTDRTPFVISFNPALPKISSIVKKHINILQSSANCKQVFPHPPVIAYKRNASLRDLLVHSELPQNKPSNQQPAGIHKCNHPRCLTCSFLQEGQTNYTFFNTNESRKISDYISCNSKNLIYLIQCKKCHSQYIGETKRKLNERFGEHRRSILNHHQLLNPTPVSLHFNQPGHSINDVQLIPLELIRSKRDSVRKAREAHLINKAKTLHPLGINRRDETRQ